MTVEVDPRFRGAFERLLAVVDLLDFDGLMTCNGYFDELPLFTTYSQIAFLDELSLVERNRVLIRAAVAHLGRILEHAERYFAGAEFDFFCAVTVTGWDFFSEEDLLTPRFWRANASKGVFDYLRLQPPTSEGSSTVAYLLDHDPDYLINDDIVDEFGEKRLERVFVQHVDYPIPRSNIEAL
ncbi:Imm15 family immunity protein [Nocardia carnea]|uniref:Imm15 family immunity protein n=1 Tax=Nocardia carnea TaxID=37328 RepID=UPI002457B954|nr:Imm15 family immunity protein [Nocardia carnea]